MPFTYPTIWPQFYTASIYKMQHLLKDDSYKDIIIESLQFLVKDKRIDLSAFCVMSNHIHIIWQPLPGYSLKDIQSSFNRQTAKRILKKLAIEKPDALDTLKVSKRDRAYQVWKREPLTIELFAEKAFMQKLEYIHNNPVLANLVAYPEDYKYSSARFYHDGTDIFAMISHYSGN